MLEFIYELVKKSNMCVIIQGYHSKKIILHFLCGLLCVNIVVMVLFANQVIKTYNLYVFKNNIPYVTFSVRNVSRDEPDGNILCKGNGIMPKSLVKTGNYSSLLQLVSYSFISYNIHCIRIFAL